MEYCTLLKNNEADLSVRTVKRGPIYIIERIKQSAEEHCAQCDFICASKKWINLSADRCINMLLKVYTRHGYLWGERLRMGGLRLGKGEIFFILYFSVWFKYLTTCMYYFLFKINFLI